MNNQIDLSLIIACYNEAQILEENVKKIKKILDNTKFNYEIIFVDDKSTDGTVELINRLLVGNKNMTLIYHKINMGRGRTVTDGIRTSKGRIVGFIDIDLDTHCRYIPSLALAIDGGADIAIAWRFYNINLSVLLRWLLSKGYNLLVRALLKVKLNDTETGCKFFNRKRILPILDEVENPRWFWDTEIIARSYYKGLKIVEIPTLFIKDPQKKSTVKILEDTFNYLKNLLRFRAKWRRNIK